MTGRGGGFAATGAVVGVLAGAGAEVSAAGVWLAPCTGSELLPVGSVPVVASGPVSVVEPVPDVAWLVVVWSVGVCVAGAVGGVEAPPLAFARAAAPDTPFEAAPSEDDGAVTTGVPSALVAVSAAGVASVVTPAAKAEPGTTSPSESAG